MVLVCPMSSEDTLAAPKRSLSGLTNALRKSAITAATLA